MSELIERALNLEIDKLRIQLAKLKNVPMKYRRMEFNAQLQKENENLRYEIEMLEQDADARLESANKQLATAQAEIERIGRDLMQMIEQKNAAQAEIVELKYKLAVRPKSESARALEKTLASREATIKVLREALLKCRSVTMSNKYFEQAQDALALPVSNEHLRAFGIRCVVKGFEEAYNHGDAHQNQLESLVNEILGGEE